MCNFWHPGTLTLRAKCQSARMSKITNGGLTQSGTRCFFSWTYMATMGVKMLMCFDVRWCWWRHRWTSWRRRLVHHWSSSCSRSSHTRPSSPVSHECIEYRVSSIKTRVWSFNWISRKHRYTPIFNTRNSGVLIVETGVFKLETRVCKLDTRVLIIETRDSNVSNPRQSRYTLV